MCEPVSATMAVAMAVGAGVSMTGDYMQQQSEWAQASGQYAYEMGITGAMRARDNMLFDLNKGFINEGAIRKADQITEETLQQQGIMASRLRTEQNNMDEAMGIARTSALNSGVSLPPQLVSSYISKKAQSRFQYTKAVDFIRKRGILQQQQVEMERDAAIISALPSPRMDPIAPQHSTALAFMRSLNAGISGATSGASFGSSMGWA